MATIFFQTVEELALFEYLIRDKGIEDDHDDYSVYLGGCCRANHSQVRQRYHPLMLFYHFCFMLFRG